MLNLQQIEASITGTSFATHLVHLDTTPSTNTLALEAAQAGAEIGVWIADEQTAGRGRGGHTWHSAGEGLYVSVLIRPNLPLSRILWLSLATGLATQAAIAQVTGLHTDLRWPNDLLLHERKLGGILVETSIATEASALRYAVIGIGINVNQASFPPELSKLATSLRSQTGQPWQREPLLAALLRCLHAELALLQGGDTTLLDRFAAASTWVHGKHVRVGEQDSYTGVTAGLTAEGLLLVQCSTEGDNEGDNGGGSGALRTVLSGGVRAL